MVSVGLSPADRGKLIPDALVGTFLGVLPASGVVGPLADLLEQRATNRARTSSA